MHGLSLLVGASARLFAPQAQMPATQPYMNTVLEPVPQFEPVVQQPQMVVYDVAPEGDSFGTGWAMASFGLLGGLAGYAAVAHFSPKRSGAVTMSLEDGDLSRRDFFKSAAAAAAALTPLAAHADGASSKAVLERARAIYGSRVFRLANASPEKVIEEQNMLQLFITGAYRSAADKPTVKELKSLQKEILKAANAGDAGATKEGLKKFIAVAKLRELDTISGGNFNPQQRRNPGAPATSEIEAQMGTASYALYTPLKPGAPKAQGKS